MKLIFISYNHTFYENCLCPGEYDACGVCNGTNECIGCTDGDAINFDPTADLACNSTGTQPDDNDCCIYSSELYEGGYLTRGDIDVILGGEYEDGYLDTYLSNVYDGGSLIAGLHSVLLELYLFGSLDDWLMENAQSQAQANTALDSFLEEYGGTDLAGFVYNINGPFSSAGGIQNYYLLSYPLAESIQLYELQNYYNITFESQPATNPISGEYGLNDLFLFSSNGELTSVQFTCEYNICSNDPSLPCGEFDLCGIFGVGECITLDELSEELLPNCWNINNVNTGEFLDSFEIQQGMSFRFLPAATTQREESNNYGEFNFNI